MIDCLPRYFFKQFFLFVLLKFLNFLMYDNIIKTYLINKIIFSQFKLCINENNE